jgi:membrane fusion protein (multidrug efflux system)
MYDLQSTDQLKPPTPDKRSIKKPMTVMLLIVVILLALVFGIHTFEKIFVGKMIAKFLPTTVTISTTTAQSENWTPRLNAVGSLIAVNGVEVSPEQSGMVTEILFKSGEMVSKNQPLIKLDDRTDQQDLLNLQAQLKLAQIKYDQQVSLFKSKSTSETSLDDARAQLQEAQAALAKTEVIIDQKTIKAPFAGRIGIRDVNLGQYVTPGNGLVSLQSMNPLYAQFSMPEQNLRHLYVGQDIELKIDNFPGKVFKGRITALDAEVNVQTRNILIEATLPNDDMKLYPGMFANIAVLLPEKENVVTVPTTAVSFSLYGDLIYVVKEEGKDADGKPILRAHERYVSTGDQQDDQIAITKGLKAGETVVTSGQLKLTNDTAVSVNNDVKLPNMSPEELKQNRS